LADQSAGSGSSGSLPCLVPVSGRFSFFIELAAGGVIVEREAEEAASKIDTTIKAKRERANLESFIDHLPLENEGKDSIFPVRIHLVRGCISVLLKAKRSLPRPVLAGSGCLIGLNHHVIRFGLSARIPSLTPRNTRRLAEPSKIPPGANRTQNVIIVTETAIRAPSLRFA